MANRSRPTFRKREKEKARQQRQKDKDVRRLEAKERKASAPARSGDDADTQRAAHRRELERQRAASVPGARASPGRPPPTYAA